MEVNHERLQSLAAFGLLALRSGGDPTSRPPFLDCFQPEEQTPAVPPTDSVPPPPQTSLSDYAEDTLEEPDAGLEPEEPRDENPASDQPRADAHPAPIAPAMPVADSGHDIEIGEELVAELLSSADEFLAADAAGAVEGQPSPRSGIQGAGAVSTSVDEQLVVCPIAPDAGISVVAESSEENASHRVAASSVSAKSKRDKIRLPKIATNSEEASDNPGEKPSSGEQAVRVGHSPEAITVTAAPETASPEPTPSDQVNHSPHVKEAIAAATEAKSATAPVEPAAPADSAAPTAQAAPHPAAGAAATIPKPPAVLLKAKTGDTDSPRAAGDIDPVKFLSRVAKAFESAHQRGSEVRLRLHPAELGALSIEVRIHDNVLTASVQAETPEAKAAIIDNLPALRERLADQGIRIDRFDVDLMDHSDRRQQSLDEQARQQEARQSASPRSSTRRVVSPEATPVSAPRSRTPGQGGLNVVI